MHERAWLVVADGRGRDRAGRRRTVSGGAGFLAHFEPNERHEVRATDRRPTDPAPVARGRGRDTPAGGTGWPGLPESGSDGPRPQAQDPAGCDARRRRLPGGEPCSTRASAPRPRPSKPQVELKPRASPTRSPARWSNALGGARRRRLRFRIARPRRRRRPCRSLHGRGAGSVPRGPRGDRVRRAAARARSSRERDSLVTKCPSKFTKRQRPVGVSAAPDGGRRVRLPRGRPAHAPSTRSARLDPRGALGQPPLGRLRPPRDLLPRRR